MWFGCLFPHFSRASAGSHPPASKRKRHASLAASSSVRQLGFLQLLKPEGGWGKTRNTEPFIQVKTTDQEGLYPP